MVEKFTHFPGQGGCSVTYGFFQAKVDCSAPVAFRSWFVTGSKEVLFESNRIGICDPVPMFRNGLRSVLSDANFEVDEPEDVTSWVGRGDGNLIVMSLGERDHWSLLNCLYLEHSHVAVIALLHDAHPASYREALRSGARSALPRHAPGAELVSVVRAAIEDRALLPLPVVRALAEGDSAPVNDEFDEEERNWISELSLGVSVDDLAWRSGYSRRTMFRRLQRVYHRLGVSRKDQALLEASRRGLI